MKTMREKYFENYEKVQVPVKGKRKVRTEYRYKGMWYAWETEGTALKRKKMLLFLAEVLSIAVYLYGALRQSDLNSMHVAAGLASLSIIPWIAEIWGVIRLIFTKSPMTVSDFDEIKNCITIGSAVRMCFLASGILIGIFNFIKNGMINADNGIALAGHLLSGIISFLILRNYMHLRYNIYKNDAKKL